MDALKCRICGKKEWNHVCVPEKVQSKVTPSSEVDDVAQDRMAVHTRIEPREAGSHEGGCLECGATAKTFEDAQKWSKHREKRRIYMKRRRE